jgi:hypothetical protein
MSKEINYHNCTNYLHPEFRNELLLRYHHTDNPDEVANQEIQNLIKQEKERFAKVLVESVYEIIKKLYSLEKEIEAIFPRDQFDITFLGGPGINIYELISTNQPYTGSEDQKEAIIKKALSLNLLKSFKSISDKFDRRKEWTPNVIPDLIRFSIICKKSVKEIGGMNVVNKKIELLTILLKKHDFNIHHQTLARLLPTGYADIQVKYETPIIVVDNIEIKTLMEMQVHTEAGLQAKEQETDIFEARRTLANNIYKLLKTKVGAKQFTKLLDLFVKNNLYKNRQLTEHSASHFLKKLKSTSSAAEIITLIIEYENLFERSFNIFQAADMLFNSESELETTRQSLEKLVKLTPKYDLRTFRQAQLIS